MLKFFNVCFLLASLLLTYILYAAEFECTADNVSTLFTESGEPYITTLEGNIKIVSADAIIECNKAVINHISGDIEIETGLTLSQGNLKITSTHSTYNMQTDFGTFTNNKFSYIPFYGRSELVKKEKDGINAKGCILTTCDRENPHYHLFCDSVQISPDKISIKGLKIYFGNKPIFYFPGYSYNLRTKKPPFQISSGHKTEIGNGLSLIFNNTSKDSKFDISEKITIGTDGLGAGIKIADGTASETQPSKGSFSSYAFKKYSGSNDDLYYGFLGEFHNEFSNKQNIIVDWRWMKSEWFFRKHLYDSFIEKSRNPNYLSYTKIIGEGAFSVNIIDDAQEDFLSAKKIPEIEFSLPYINMGKWLGSFQFIPTRFVDDKGNEYSRVMSDIEFDRPISAGFSKITPFVRFRNAYYVQDQDEMNNFISSAGFNLKLLALSQEKNNSVYFSPTFSIFSNFVSEKNIPFSSDLYDFNPDGTFTSINLSWDFWKNNIHKGNITSMIFYDIEETEFEDSIFMLDFAQNKQWSFHCQERFNPSNGGIKEMNNTVIFKKGNTQVGVGNKYLSGYFEGITGSFNKIYGNWEFDASLDYDRKKSKFTSQHYTIQKQVHCLIVGIRFSKNSSTSVGFFVMPAFLARR
ncbi:MAG: LPS-assembly protein LptD [candidate division TA06 bacterium ADurb.Bin131]|uniref:LPS-assembly protein LptD n=1 Tax=candidate division TA06 bacterium ADurb.Bin131 TaxID=1852827 RepID=A0A1V6CCN7_UNCT6|nr:MAG: LPS-assembly protein LptD [candidate division TA06 bacterium ADurb.Bin131]